MPIMMIMPMLIVLGLGAALSGWSILLILSGERQRRMSESLNTALTVRQIKKN